MRQIKFASGRRSGGPDRRGIAAADGRAGCPAVPHQSSAGARRAHARQQSRPW